MVLIETLIIRLRIKKLFSSHQHFTTKAEGQKYRESSNETDTMEMQLCNVCGSTVCELLVGSLQVTEGALASRWLRGDGMGGE